MIKPFYFLLGAFLLVSDKAKSQSHYNVFGKVKESFYTPPNLFADFDSTNCEPAYFTIKKTDNWTFFILDKVDCKNKSWYIVLENGKKYFVDFVYMADSKSIDSFLNVAKLKTPKFNDRMALAILDEDSIRLEKELANKEYAKGQKVIVDSLEKALAKIYAGYRTKNIVVWNWSWSYPNEYSSFADMDITVINPYKQKIKYISFTLIAFNAVGDRVKDGIHGNIEKTVRGIGPIEYSEKGSYNFESVFYSKVIATMRIKQIKIQFFDGSVKVINSPVSLNVEDE